MVICCGEGGLRVTERTARVIVQVGVFSGVYQLTEFRDRRRLDFTTCLLPFEGPWRIGRITVKILTSRCEEYHLSGTVTAITVRRKGFYTGHKCLTLSLFVRTVRPKYCRAAQILRTVAVMVRNQSHAEEGLCFRSTAALRYTAIVSHDLLQTFFMTRGVRKPRGKHA